MLHLSITFHRKLGLDLVVRDDTGDVINLDDTGVIDLYKRVSRKRFDLCCIVYSSLYMQLVNIL